MGFGLKKDWGHDKGHYKGHDKSHDKGHYKDTLINIRFLIQPETLL